MNKVSGRAKGSQGLELAIVCGIVVCILVIYGQAVHFDFVNYDDDFYVYRNSHVLGGLTLDGIRYAFTGVVSSNWMPLTLLSHMLDVQLFGTDAGMHHLTNVALHAIAAVLLFLFLRRASRTIWPPAFVAFVFAVHPLHVGSVAWIAERKDVLSAVFFFGALYLYLRYTEQPSVRNYALMAGVFACGLMSKPMLVTFPFVLLLMDVWPLRRDLKWKLVREKLPLVGMAAASSVITYMVQGSTGAVDQVTSFGMRTANALMAYAIYIAQTFWPVRLSVYYPYPKSIPAWQIGFALAILLGITALALLTRRTRPYLAAGWLWYLGTLIPVIGLVQVGTQSHADRYTYIPMTGILIMIAWGARDIVEARPNVARAIAVAASIAGALLVLDAHAQAAYWEGSETLFARAIEIDNDNWLAHHNLGYYLIEIPGRQPEAIAHFDAIRRILPNNGDEINNLGVTLMDKGHAEDSIRFFQDVLKSRSNVAEAHFNLALAESKAPGREADAVREYQAAVRLEPENAVMHQSLGLFLVKLGRTQEAIPELEAAVRLKSDYSGEYNLGVVLLNTPGRQRDAIAHLEAAQRLQPDPAVAATLARLRGKQ